MLVQLTELVPWESVPYPRKTGIVTEIPNRIRSLWIRAGSIWEYRWRYPDLMSPHMYGQCWSHLSEHTESHCKGLGLCYMENLRWERKGREMGRREGGGGVELGESQPSLSQSSLTITWLSLLAIHLVIVPNLLVYIHFLFHQQRPQKWTRPTQRKHTLSPSLLGAKRKTTHTHKKKSGLEQR